jgi:3,4-dihydroxyphenylacetate 2,3-dioxygenase
MEGITMGEVVGAALLAHVPTIMLPKETRYELNDGKETSLVPGLEKLRKDVFETLDYDTVIVMDSHWATTVEFVISAHEHREGKYTAEELPRGMSQVPYSFKGDPEFAESVVKYDEKNGTWITPISDPYLPIFYATVNLWDYLGKGIDKKWVSVSVCQTATTEDFLRAGRALGEAIRDSDRKVPYRTRSTSCAICVSTRRATRFISSHPRLAPLTKSASSGSRLETTSGFSTRCLSSSRSSRRQTSATI